MTEPVSQTPSQARSAEIIPFPSRANAPQASGADDAQARLRTALAALDAALERQREAVARWRMQMDALQGNVGGLNDALQTLQARLGNLDGQVQGLNTTAMRLDTQADLLLQASTQTR